MIPYRFLSSSLNRNIKNWILLFIVNSSSSLFFSLSGQVDTVFWFAAPAITNSNSNSFRTPISINISSYNTDAMVTISQPGGKMTKRTVFVPALSTLIVDLTNDVDEVECKGANVILNKGIKISSTAPISVYYENSSQGSPELFVLKGRNALGYDFWISAQNRLENSINFSPSYSSFYIIAVKDFTIVNITPTADIFGHSANIPFSITLHSGQCYVARSASNLPTNHLLGTHVTSDNPIAITLADDILDATPLYGGCADLIGDQTIPVHNIGTEYIAVKGLLNAPYDKLYVTASRNGTVVNMDGNFLTSLNAGESYEASLVNINTYIQSNFPIYVFQLTGIGCELGSAVLPQIICTGSASVSFVRSTDLDVYITLVTQGGGQNNFLVNGMVGIVNSGQFSVVPGTGNAWYTATVKLDSLLFPKGSIISVTNNIRNFQLGVLQGSFFNGASFGYFSDFTSNKAFAGVDHKLPCLGSSFQLLADTVLFAKYTWYGPNGFHSSDRNPIILNANPTHSGKYVLEVETKDCGLSYDTIVIQIIDCVNQLLLCYPFDGNINDYSGHDNDGKMLPGYEAKLTLDRFGNKDRAYNFKNSFILVPQSPSILSPDTAITICSWVNLNQVNGLAPIVCKSNTISLPLTPQYTLGITDSSTVIFGYNKDGSFPETKVSSDADLFPLDTWFHLAITFDGQMVKYYKNGILFSTKLEMGRIRSTNFEPLEIGRYSPSPTYYLDGDLDILKIYGRALSSEEIFKVYQDKDGCNETCAVILDSICHRICKGERFNGFDQTGIYIDTFQTVNHCDSIIILNLYVQDIDILQTDTTLCNQDNFSLHVQLKDFPNGLSSCCPMDMNDKDLERGLLAYYPFCKNAHDVSGNGRHGTANAAFLTTDRFGISNNAFGFNSKLHSLITTRYLEKTSSNNFTYSVWVNPNNIQTLPPEGVDLFATNQINLLTDGQCIIHPVHGENFGSANQNAGSGLFIGSNGLYLIEHSDLYVRVALVYSGTLSGWHQYTIVYENKLPKLFIDGKFIKSGIAGTKDIYLSSGYDPNSLANYLDSGFGAGFQPGLSDLSSYFNGKIDEICFWNRILPDTEIMKWFQITSTPVDLNSLVNWSTGDTSLNISVASDTTKTYYCKIKSGDHNCIDSITLTRAKLVDLLVKHEICEGQSFLNHDSSGTYVDTLINLNGCDTIRTLELMVNNFILKNESKTICLGESYCGYNLPGNYTDTLRSSIGCDTIRMLNLSLAPLRQLIIYDTICYGHSYLGHTQPGLYMDTLQNSLGCDTVRTLHLAVLQTPTQDTLVEICEGSMFELGHHIYFNPGRYTDTLTNRKGCDSIVHLNLVSKPVYMQETNVDLCIGDQYLVGNKVYTQSGKYIDHLKSSSDCDSVISTILRLKVCNDIYVPSVFSPNGDNINDLFFPIGKDIQDYQIKIFERWGSLIFQSQDHMTAWDGTYKNQQVNPGVYVYLIIGTRTNGSTFTISGNITVVF